MTLRSLDFSFGRYMALRPPDEGGGAGVSPTPPAGSSPSPDAGAGGAPPPSPSQVSGEVPNEKPDGASALPFMEDPATFDSLSSGDDLDELPLPAADTGPKPEGTTAPSEPKKEPPKAAEPPKSDAQPPKTLPSSEPKAPPDQKGSASPPASDLEALLQAFENPAAAKPIREHLAREVYALSEEERNALDTDAVGAIPQIMARVHHSAVTNAVKLMHMLIPSMIASGVQDRMAASRRGEAALADFFRAWPGLNAGEHTEMVNQYAKLFRANNPGASRADAIKFVGAAIHAATGIPVVAPNGNGTQPPRRVERTPVSPPFAPARPGARQVESQVLDESPFAGMGKDFEE